MKSHLKTSPSKHCAQTGALLREEADAHPRTRIIARLGLPWTWLAPSLEDAGVIWVPKMVLQEGRLSVFQRESSNSLEQPPTQQLGRHCACFTNHLQSVSTIGDATSINQSNTGIVLFTGGPHNNGTFRRDHLLDLFREHAFTPN